MIKRLKSLSKADYLTIVGLALSIVSIYLLLSGDLYTAIAVAVFSVIFDFMDGIVARKYGGSRYGAFLDAGYDIFGFVVFPVVLIMKEVTAISQTVVVIISIVYVVGSILRLADFSSQSNTQKQKGYVGMPVFYSLLAVIFIEVEGGSLSATWLAIMAPLMISDSIYKKPKGYWVIALLLFVVGYFTIYA